MVRMIRGEEERDFKNAESTEGEEISKGGIRNCENLKTLRAQRTQSLGE